MSYQVELVNKQSLSHIKIVEVVNEPKIKEEINGEYSLNFEAHYEAKSDLNASVLVKVNGQHYQIKKLTKSRSDSITLSVQCEHVSYELIIDGDYEEDWEIESTAQGMISSILNGTRFTLGDCISTNFAYYRTKRRDKRQQLKDIANLFVGELHYDNFTVHLVHQRGSDKGLDIKLGVNLLGVTEEIDFVEGTTAYELDLVDLSRVNGYKLDFSSAEIGDTIGMSDNVLGINAKERIIAIEYNPFKRQLPTVTVGQYMHDFAEYLKDEDESTLKTNETWLEVFSIGETNVLYLDDLDTGGATLELDEKAPVVTIQVKQEHIGDTILVNLFDSSSFQYANYNEHAFDLNGRLIIDGDFPRGTTGSVEIIITEKSTGEKREYFVNVEDISADSFEDYWLESILVGTEEIIHLEGLNISNGGEGAELSIYEKVNTITIKVKANYKDYVKAVSIYNDSNVIVYTRGSSHFDSNGQVIIKREFPLADRGSIKIAVMNPETKAKQTFLVGVSTGSEIYPDSDGGPLESVLVGTEDCLHLDGFNITNGGEGAELSIYEKVSTITIKVKAAYKNYVKAVSIYNAEGVIVYTRGSSHFDANGQVIIKRQFPLTERGSIKIAIMHPETKVKQTFLVGVSIGSEIYPDDIVEESMEEYFMEFGSCPLAEQMTYVFENTAGYDAVKSISTGLISSNTINGTVTLVASAVEGGGKVKSVKILGAWSGTKPNAAVNVQVVCYNAPKEVN